METKTISPIEAITTHLVKSEDLNHHGTLFAGRTAEWFVESGFIAAATIFDPKSVVCLKIHGMHFSKPARPGQILRFTSKVIYTGRTSIIAHIEVCIAGCEEQLVSGFITFISVDEQTKPKPHGMIILPEKEKDKVLYEQACQLRAN